MKTTELLNDWHPETRSLLSHLEKAGFAIHSANNGEGEDFKPADFKTREEFLNELLACDEASLYVTHPSRAKRYWLFLVLGNSPGELVCDYSAPENDVGAVELNKAISACADKWEGKPQPKIEASKRYPEEGGE